MGGLEPLPQPAELGRRTNPQEGRCILIVGRLGSGKTSYAMHRAVRQARRWRLPLYANAPVRPDARVLKDWNALDCVELCQDRGRKPCRNRCHERDTRGCAPAVIVLDELHLWYPSSQSISPGKEAMQDAFRLLSFARKRGWTVYATSQNTTRVHTGFRQLLTELLVVRPVMEGLWHTVGSYDPDTQKPILKVCGGFNPRRARYDTRAEVEPLWGAGDRSELARPAPAPSADTSRPNGRSSEWPPWPVGPGL